MDAQVLRWKTEREQLAGRLTSAEKMLAEVRHSNELLDLELQRTARSSQGQKEEAARQVRSVLECMMFLVVVSGIAEMSRSWQIRTRGAQNNCVHSCFVCICNLFRELF